MPQLCFKGRKKKEKKTMPKTRQEKAELVSALKDKFARAKAVVFARVSGYTMNEANELRSKAKAEGLDVMITKKTLLERAAKDAGIELNRDLLEGSILTAFGYDDEIAPARVVAKFAKDHASVEVSSGVLEGFIGEGVLFFGGPGAVEKAKLAGEIVTKRLDLIGVKPEELRVDYIGINALFHPHTAPPAAPLREVGLRVAGRTKARADAAKIAYEVYALPTNGPSGISAGAIREGVTEVLGYYHTFIPRERVKPTVAVVEVK